MTTASGTTGRHVIGAGAPIDNPDDVLDAYRRHLSTGRARLAAMVGGAVEVASAGARVTDATGREYVDCGGYGVFLLGHCHPAVVDAVTAQVRTHPLATRLLLEPTVAHAARTLAAVAPAGLDRVHFVNSGAEATEAAVKLARAHGKHMLVSADGGYHGKTTGALALTAAPLYQEPFRPLLPAVHVPYGDADALDVVLQRHPDACVVLEPVQGEGGVILPPAGYLRQVERLCRAYGAFLVLDEIQTGLGRLGSWWGADAENVHPDVLLVGKNLSGGVVPVAAAVATTEAYAPFDRDPFLHTSTFAGAPIAMAAASAAVEAIAGEGLIERARRLGSCLLAMLTDTLADLRDGIVVDIRGRGLLLGVELRTEALAAELVLELVQNGVLVSHSLNAHRVVRLTPPAVLTDADLTRVAEAFAAAAKQLSRHLTGKDSPHA